MTFAGHKHDRNNKFTSGVLGLILLNLKMPHCLVESQPLNSCIKVCEVCSVDKETFTKVLHKHVFLLIQRILKFTSHTRLNSIV